MSFDLSTMEYTAEFIRGWPTAPDSGTREVNRYPLAAGVDCSNGDLVTLNSSSEVIQVAADTASNVFIVVRGTLDDKSVNSCRRPILLPGNYIVRTTNVTGVTAVGDQLMADTVTAGGRTYGTFKKIVAPGDPYIGVVQQVIVGAGGVTSYIIEVK